ncbi:hypothetical protein LB518_21805 [Mesorhizobium sp. BR1-1-16]|uniref:hypothetical protein n=1 Tax=Mesorhizobium sp. BR1-1-16 TaxID=2876653 RepID=UPI001CCE6641|nr:hypothetical protein [Mesorhizobium sp. BR1-1-16]MBZ9938947.1 hypothetical protein [Mesorhizobium sp. BR1-1-16]
MRTKPPADITLPQFTLVFVIFGVLAIFALLWPETTQQDLALGRTRATIWVTSVMLIPAFVLFPYRTLSPGVANLAHLFWTFAYLLFLIHAYWAVFIIFGGVGNTFRQMGALIAGVNFLLVLWWGLDVILLWTMQATSPAAARFQIATRTFTFLVFAITLIVLRGGPVRTLGIALTVATVLAVVIRFWVRDRDAEYVPVA